MIAMPPPSGAPCRTLLTAKGTWTPTSLLCPAEDRKRSDVAAARSGGGSSLRAGPRRLSPLLEVAAPRSRPDAATWTTISTILAGKARTLTGKASTSTRWTPQGRPEDAQRIRWKAFEERLSVERLRAYLKALPDFEDVLAEERAMEYALVFRSFSTALHFLHAWPEHRHAARLVLARHAEIDGNLYYLLDPAARWLEGAIRSRRRCCDGR